VTGVADEAAHAGHLLAIAPIGIDMDLGAPAS
jgi:hypothetical protein